MMKLYISCVLILFCSLTVASTQEQNVNPGINRHYQNAEFDNWVNAFERVGREVYDQRHAIVRSLQLKPGMHVADIGAGTGFFSLLFAKEVSDSGMVYAVDISKDFIVNIKRRADEQGLKNIRTVMSTDQDVLLAANSIDFAFVCDTYHHFEYPQTILASIYKALKPGGKLVILDFRKEPGVSSAWVMSHVRADKNEVIRELEQAGFTFAGESDLLKTNYFLWFNR